jgi:DNA invertase Pin-like site-specific DNA recombinase
MIAAIYARKSNDNPQVPDALKSVAGQIAGARLYASGQGWVVDEGHIYTDDGVSGALFGKNKRGKENRPGLARLLNALSPRPPFQVLIMSEESRLGRESIETAWTLKRP